MSGVAVDPVLRFGAMVLIDDGCWHWSGSHNDRGYAKFWDGSRLVYAHRFMYELMKTAIRPGMTIDHLCRNRGCVNPAHLDEVSLRDNILRGEAPSAVHARKTHCPRGHLYDEANTRVYRGMRFCRTCRRERNRVDGTEVMPTCQG